MKYLGLLPFLISLSGAACTDVKSDPAAKCYTSPLPAATVNSENRTVPWGTPSYILPNGTTCCSSLDQVRAGIDAVDDALLTFLAQRAAFVREATRFKATLDSVNVPSRNQEVIDEAVAAANTTTPPLPQVIAQGVFEAILNSSVPFEECVYESY